MASCIRHVKNFKTFFLRSNCSYLQVQPTKYGFHTQSLSRRQVRHLLGKPNIHKMGNQRVPVWVCGLTGARNKSTDAAEVTATAGAQAPSLPEGYIPEPPPVPVPGPVEELAQQLTSLGEPTLSSLGLCNYTPAGLVQTAVEALHVAADIPWWGAIVAGTIVLRLVMFPLVILSQRNAANMSNHMPTVQRLQEKFTQARMSGNPLEAARAAQDLQDYMSRNKVNPIKNLMMPLVQLPVFLSVFVGLRAMANLPVESMSTGGVLWFPDLTMSDPYYAMPIMTSLTFLLTVELGVDGVKAQTMTPMMRTVLRAMPLVMLPFIMNFPAAMLCYWFTSNSFSLCQVLLLRIPKIRNFFNIPETVKHDTSFVAKKKSFREGFRESWDNSKLAASMHERQRMDAMRFKEAGTGPLQKTFPYDPTKVKAKQS